MDYDDNDISRHNLQLAGEGRSKSSSVLRPYDFPRFDFDDNLQAHLRFDSLVETEVFLGIQSQEDNQWIEDYSRVSNGMEFNSTPAESCSISRRNNVWSEATSSESVEMLLKSVGQEEIMPGDSNIPVSNAFDGQDTLAKHLEPVSKLDTRNDEYPANSESSLPQDILVKDYSALKGHVEEQLPEPEKPSASQANAESISAKDERSTNQGNYSYDAENFKISAKKSMNLEAGDDSLHFAGMVDDVNSNLGKLSTSEKSEPVNADVSHESCNDNGQEKHVSIGTGQEDTKTVEGKTGEASVCIHTMDNSHCLVTESGVLSSQGDVDGSLDHVKETANISNKRESELNSSEGDDKIMSFTISDQATKHEVKVMPKNTEMAGVFGGCRDGSAVDGIDQHSSELGTLSAGHCVSAERKMDSSVQLTCRRDDDKMEKVPANPFKSESISEMPLVSIDDNKIPVESCDCVAEINTSRSSDMVVLSSAAENKEAENVEGCHSDSILTLEEVAAHLPTSASDDFKQRSEDSLAHRQADFSETEQDICKTKEEVKRPTSDIGDVDHSNVGPLSNDQTTQLLDVSKGVKSNDVHKLPLQTSVVRESANDAAHHAKRIASAALYDHSKNGQREPAVAGLSHPDDNCGKAAGRILPDVTIGTEIVSVSKVEVSIVDDAARPPPSGMDAKSPQPVEKSNDISSSESPSTETTNSLYSNHSEVRVGCDKSSLKESVNADSVSGEAHDVTMMKIEGEKESAQVAEVDKASCGSPTIISSSEPSRMEKDNQEEAKGSEIKDLFVKDSQTASDELERKDAPADDSSFTFKVSALPDTTGREPGKSWSPLSNVAKRNSSMVIQEVTLSSEGKTARTASQKTPRQSAKVSDGEHVHGTPKGTSERKGRRVSAKGIKEHNKKGNQVKSTKQESAKGDKVSNNLLSSTSSGPHVQSGQMISYGHIEQSNTKLSGAVAVPDLNTSALNNSSPPSASFRQPFSDLQQVQLRAQIFVYGSLIQGTAPDEACMVSAFGSSDGRSIWEPVWRAAVERARSQKSNANAAETPLHSQSSARTSDTAARQGSHASKVPSSPVARASSKAAPSAVVNPIIPLSSPLWSISTPSRDSLPSTGTHKGPIVDYQHSVTPLHSYQTPPIRNYVGHTSWPSQPCFPGPWLASPQTSTFTSSVRFQPVTMTETVKLTPVKDTSGALTAGMKHVTSSPAVQTVGPSPVYVGMSLLSEPKSIASAEKHSVDSKPRKRKKAPNSDTCQVSFLSEARTEAAVDSKVATILSSPVIVTASASPAPAPSPASPASDAVLNKAAADALARYSVDRSKKGDLDAGKGVSCSEETLNKVAEAKSQAEDASALAAEAVSHSEDLWSQLGKQKESGLTSEVEAKIASAAAAIAAAASVAKAAAAAAKVACNAALQAKLMAEEAVLSSEMSGLVPSTSISSAVHDLGNATPASILKGDKITNQSSSILVAAKEAAKRRVEAASAASKQAENLDAIVKAAELAAAAVSQAGKIVAMGEPLPLNDLIEAGPEGYWKPTSGISKEQTGAIGLTEVDDVPSTLSGEDLEQKGGLKAVGNSNIHPRERSNDSLDHVNLVDGITQSIHPGKTDMRSGKGSEASKIAKSSGVVSESDPAPRTEAVQNEHEELLGSIPDESIKEGSLVEVFKHGDGLKSAWYSANVLTLEDGKAYVSYTDLLLEEGSGNLCEWVPIEGEGDKPPVIRAAHPLTALQFQATRKRQRAALGDYAWSVGDRVDVWIDDCWWEGVVTEKNEKDETTLKVHFPAQGETSVVRAWNLRTLRSWNNGKWVECSSSKGHNASEQSDTPQEKRRRLGSPVIPTKGKDKLATDVDSASGKTEGSKLLDLSTSDRIFDVGKTVKEDNKRAATRRPLRSGQQKEGSRVVFGVPKPTGKKRKFMEVSKHFPANKSDKSNETSDSVKFAKYLMPQATAARGWKVPSRNDSKEKRAAESKTRIPSSRKPSRTLPQRDNLNSTMAHDNDNMEDHRSNIDDVGHDENTSEKLVQRGFSASGENAEAPLSSLLAQTLSTSSKKVSSSNTRTERLNRGRLAPSSGRLNRIEEDKVHAGNSHRSAQEVSEPRRSNRRIQPTHRLLEGLQSSMIIPKMPSISHDKSQKNQNRNVPARGK